MMVLTESLRSLDSGTCPPWSPLHFFPSLTPVPFVNSTDELFKSSAYYLNGATKYLTLSTQTPFDFTFRMERGPKGYFRLLEEGGGRRFEEGVWLKESRWGG
jgi:hypothetical protein